MKRRRIDFYHLTLEEHFNGRIVDVLKETKEYFIVNVPTLPPEFDRIRTCFFSGNAIAGVSDEYYKIYPLQWKPHEYRQEARQSCLFAYWFLKRKLGKDPAGIIAKFVYSTRFEEVWETFFCQGKKKLVANE